MANTKSAKKAVRSSARKRSHNLMWKTKYKQQLKAVYKAVAGKETEEVILEKFKALQKSLDKAAKEKAIHKNKADRVKSNYAKRIAAHLKGEDKTKSEKIAKTRPSKPRSKRSL
ncbi:MAG: 30S ribosomal protein S20 [Patescibacteria group bacterium]|nr:30S ribosomal protein S20 [Patescibacteria group bacterium]MBU1952661.1 30S ribosomal protein S20 [Patescibacteria group bacterium]